MKKFNIHDTLTTLFFYLAILIFIIGFNFTDSPPPPSGWYQQFMLNLNNQPLSDIFFLDSLTGWAVTGSSTPTDTNFILKTINGGDNWIIKYVERRTFRRIVFLDNNTGYVCGGYANGTRLYKTTNDGENWFLLSSPATVLFNDMAVLNQDTIWLTDSDGLVGGVFRTTNGGQSWTQQYHVSNNNPNKIYMFDRNIGFITTTGTWIYKTENSGENWTLKSTNDTFTDMFFVDSLMGWKVIGNERDSVKKTTNGGITWFRQLIPHFNWISTMFKISGLNKDTLWGVGGEIQWVPGNFRGVVYKTTNGGTNWSYQIPDTVSNYASLMHIKFINKLNGWVYLPLTNPYTGFNGFHTVTGGDTITYYGIQKISSEIPKNYILKQNYPNPFNPRTVIPYSLKSAGYVRIIAYDMLGREVQRLVDQKQSAGEYEVDFMGKFCSSGVYFYRMTVDGNVIGTKTMVLLK